MTGTQIEPHTFSVSKIKVLGLGLLALLFALACLALVVYAFTADPDNSSGYGANRTGGRFVALIAGAIGFLFFGGGGAYFIWKKLREPKVLTLSGKGISLESGGFIPWENFDAVGTGRTAAGPYGAKIIGIRVKSQEDLVGTMTAEEICKMLGVAKAGKAVGRIMPRRGANLSEHALLHTLASMPHHDAVAMLQWSRSMSGWDVSWSPFLFNRSSAAVVRIIEDYHRAALQLRS